MPKIIFYGFIIISVVVMLSAGIKTHNKVVHIIKDRQELAIQLDNLKKEKEKLENRLKELQNNTPGIKESHLKDIIRSVLAYLGEKNTKDWTRLLCLTIATESNMGKYTKQLKGPAKGITQVEPTTERVALDWSFKHDKNTYNKIKNLRIPAKVCIHEAEYNLAYSIALSYVVYRMRRVNPVNKTTQQLAQLYKKYYNTYKGKATVDSVLTKLITLNVKL